MIQLVNKSESERFPVPKRGAFNFKEININDPRIWSMISRGDCVTLFQLETPIGIQLSKQVKPQNIQELAALVAISRPGCSESKITESYIKRKHGLEEVVHIHPALEPILKNTYSLIIFQEDIIQIGIDIAGMNEADADYYLRKGIGRKDTKIIAECESVFLKGCQKKGIIDEKTAKDLFEIIKKFQRFGFNKCITPDTVIETKNGFKTIEDLKIGEFVNSPNGFIEVSDKFSTGLQDVFEVELESGRRIKCTMNHKFLCENGIKYTLWDIINNDYKIICEKL